MNGNGEMNPQLWWVIITVAGLAITIIGFFIKRLISTTDEHGDEIKSIKESYMTKADFKDELKGLRQELKNEIHEISTDVKKIKENCLTKDDFYRIIADFSKQVDKLINMHMNDLGG